MNNERFVMNSQNLVWLEREELTDDVATSNISLLIVLDYMSCSKNEILYCQSKKTLEPCLVGRLNLLFLSYLIYVLLSDRRLIRELQYLE